MNNLTDICLQKSRLVLVVACKKQYISLCMHNIVRGLHACSLSLVQYSLLAIHDFCQ